jgi:hypothetical protein
MRKTIPFMRISRRSMRKTISFMRINGSECKLICRDAASLIIKSVSDDDAAIFRMMSILS